MKKYLLFLSIANSLYLLSLSKAFWFTKSNVFLPAILSTLTYNTLLSCKIFLPPWNKYLTVRSYQYWLTSYHYYCFIIDHSVGKKDVDGQRISPRLAQKNKRKTLSSKMVCLYIFYMYCMYTNVYTFIHCLYELVCDL